ncbi:holin [Shewanella surugensis]|uniref:Phage holin family protein n=1 Tax=Shewanella surugensis TaxID=212020 RepID=A0ABT0LD08_9GAMM|nr:HP1 family phage holin [Shewanella surugensis]MCL1125217.1 phage holin family protein [Shewanella surugensis]
MSSLEGTGIQRVLSNASYSASVSTAAGSALTVNDWALLLGIILAASTFATNWAYRAIQDKRDSEKHELEKQWLKLRLQKCVQDDFES